MDETIYVIFKVQFVFALEVWFSICCPKDNIYILNVAALDETIIHSCLHFSMQNIVQSLGLVRASRWSNVNFNQ